MNKQLINEKLLEELKKTFFSFTHWNFGKKISIVPKTQEHRYIIKTFPIDDSILDYYFERTRKSIDTKWYNELLESGYIGEINRTLYPYPFCINGAYYDRNDLIRKFDQILNRSFKLTTNSQNEIKYLDDLIPYFNRYTDGFISGYKNFEKDCVQTYLNRHSDKEDFATKVFEFVSKESMTEFGWLGGKIGFTFDYAPNNEVHQIMQAFEDGQSTGYFYRAWGIILSSSQLFAQHFKIKFKEIKTAEHLTKSEDNFNECPYFENRCTASIKTMDKSCFSICPVYKGWNDLINGQSEKFDKTPFETEKVIEKLNNIEEVTKRLNLWLKEYNEPLYGWIDKISEETNELRKHQNNLKYWSLLKKENENSLTEDDLSLRYGNLAIPQIIYKKCFERDSKSIDFSLWMYTFQANQVYQIILKIEKWKIKLNSSLSIEHMESKLNQLNIQVVNAKNFLRDNPNTDIYSGYDREYNPNIELLRVIDDVYLHKNLIAPFENSSSIDFFANHKLLKPYLESQLNSASETKLIETIDNDRNFIKGKFNLRFIPQGNNGIYEVVKNGETRKFKLKKYFSLDLENWETYIDEQKSKKEKLEAIANAIFSLKKDKYDNSHPEVLRLLDKNLEHICAIKEYINSFEVENSSKSKDNIEPSTSRLFEDLFYDKYEAISFLDILKQTTPPLIDSEYNYIGKSKGAICIWIDEMKEQGIVKHFSDRKIYTQLIPLQIKNFSINESMFGKYQKRAEEKYKLDLRRLISEVKLSQTSQKRELGK